MRKIKKNCDLSIAYKNWEESLETKNLAHPKYNSTKGEFYTDIVMQLFKCQKGLCAYTEQKICDKLHYEERNWRDGKYILPKPEIKGQLEHFDESLKAKSKAKEGIKDWLWSNLFMIDSDVNNKKGTKTVDEILKPDKADYDPFLLMEYNIEQHTFLPKIDLEQAVFERVRKMIEVLQLNLVYNLRRDILSEKLELICERIKSWDSVYIYEYPTAFAMIRKEFEGREKELRTKLNLEAKERGLDLFFDEI